MPADHKLTIYFQQVSLRKYIYESNCVYENYKILEKYGTGGYSVPYRTADRTYVPTYHTHIPQSHTVLTYRTHAPYSRTVFTYRTHIPYSHTVLTYFTHIPYSHTVLKYRILVTVTYRTYIMYSRTVLLLSLSIEQTERFLLTNLTFHCIVKQIGL